jgi:hypothetical protein
MLDGKPLFPNSRDNRYSNITELRGTPSEEVIQSLGKKNARCVRSLPRSEKVPLENKFPAADSSGKGPNETCTDQSRSVVGNDVGN